MSNSSPTTKLPGYILILGILLALVAHLLIYPEVKTALTEQRNLFKELWATLPGFVVAFLICKAPAMTGLRTILHELRHAAVIILTGNKVTRFKFNSNKEAKESQTLAQVFYLFRRDSWEVLSGPFIVLAPYFFPLLTLPTVLICSFLPIQYRVGCLSALGVAYGLDLFTSIRDIANINNIKDGDFSKYKGGIIFGVPFVIVTNLLLLDCLTIWTLWFLTR